MWVWALLAGCIFVRETVFVDSGADSGEVVDDGAICTSDDECGGNFACAHNTSSSTDGHGCVERCWTDWDCKAGSLCSDDGACR
jgi:hypothetical protein